MTSNPQSLLTAVRASFARGVVFAGFLSFFVTLLHLVVPLFMLQVYDRVIGSRSIDTLVALAVISLGALVVFGILEYIRGRTLHIVGNNLVARLNIPMLRAAISNAVQGQRGGVTQAVRDLNELRNFVAGNSISVTLELVWSPLFLIILYLLHPVYVILGLAAAALMAVIGLMSSFMTRRALAATSREAGEAYGEMEGTVRNAEVIEAMGMLGPLARRWQAQHQRIGAQLDRASMISKAFWSVSRAARLAVQILVLSAGAYLVIAREVSPGTMIAASIMVARLLHPFQHLVDGWRKWVFAAGAYERLTALLGHESPVARDMTLPRPVPRLVAENVSFVPPGVNEPVLRDVSFVLEPGEVLGVIGPSGAGKSTLARHLVGVIRPTRGGVYLDGHSTYLWERENFGSYVGYLPQNPSILEGSVRENIARMGDADPLRVVEAARKAGLHELLGRLPHGYETQVGDSGYALSGGARQRLALARALFGDPVLLVLDEPNANLDFDGQIALDRCIRQAKAEGVTVVLIAHRPSAVTQADKLLLLMNGGVEAFGPKSDVLASDKVKAYPSKQMRVVGKGGPRLVTENE